MSKKSTSIGQIGNYYGGLSIYEKDGVYFWGIDDVYETDWEEIPKSLYDSLLAFQETNE